MDHMVNIPATYKSCKGFSGTERERILGGKGLLCGYVL